MIKIIYWISRNEMIMTMRNFISYKHCANPYTSCRLLNCWRKFFCCEKYRRIIWLRHICKMINFTLRNYECMPKSLWKNIKKCIHKFIFIYLVWRNFSWDDTRKKSGHIIYNHILCNAWITDWGIGCVLKKMFNLSFISWTEAPSSKGLGR